MHPDRIPKDRALGEEWADWEGDLEAYEGALSEPKRVFLLLSAIGGAIVVVALLLLWYLILPRLRQIHPHLPVIASVLVAAALGVLLLYAVLLLLLVVFKRNLLSHLGGHRVLGEMLLPMALTIGRWLGLSKDRVAHSFIKVSNALVCSKDPLNREGRPVLILLPRCLKKVMRDQIMQIAEARGCKLSVVGGGSAARRLIGQINPQAIVAVACERDLMSGIQDIATYMPVIGIPNQRPEGPCKNTEVDLSEVEQAIHFFTGGGNTTTPPPHRS